MSSAWEVPECTFAISQLCKPQDEEAQSWLTSPEVRPADVSSAWEAAGRLTELYDEALAHTMRTVSMWESRGGSVKFRFQRSTAQLGALQSL